MSEETIYKAEEARKLVNHSDNTGAYVVIGAGVALLLANLFGFHLMEILWPGFILVPGLLLMWPSYSSTADQQSQLSFLAIPGAMITAVGALLFIMNITGHFEAWAYSWTLIWAAAAAGWMYMKRFDPQDSVHETGYKFIRVLVFMFMGLSLLFELVIFGNFAPIFPALLIGYGIYLIYKNKHVEATR